MGKAVGQDLEEQPLETDSVAQLEGVILEGNI